MVGYTLSESDRMTYVIARGESPEVSLGSFWYCQRLDELLQTLLRDCTTASEVLQLLIGLFNTIPSHNLRHTHIELQLSLLAK